MLGPLAQRVTGGAPNSAGARGGGCRDCRGEVLEAGVESRCASAAAAGGAGAAAARRLSSCFHHPRHHAS